MTKEGVECDIVNTGQHYDYEMNLKFFSELSLPEPSTNLNVGKGTPNEQVSAIISGLGARFQEHRPDFVIVPGDTNSALAAGIACSKAGVKVAHLESGCRSNDFRMSEEVNRRLLDHMSELLLCPTQSCVRNVREEKVLADSVVNSGDTMYDSVLKFRRAVDALDVNGKYGLEAGGYAFMTLHRAETVDNRNALGEVVGAVASLRIPTLFSVHPRTRERLREFGIRAPENLRLLEPLPYVDTLALAKDSEFVLTDSGGLQKEAFWLGRPSLILRDTTEWTEIVKVGGAFLVGTQKKRILNAAKKVGKVSREVFRKSTRIFGYGKASEKVVRALVKEADAGAERKE